MERIDQIFNNYRLVDLTHILQEGMPSILPYIRVSCKSREKGDKYNSYILHLTEHHGTHVDSPFHVGGKKSINEYPLEMWHGPCNVVDMRFKNSGECVLPEDIKKWEDSHGRINKHEIVLLNYGWDKKWRVNTNESPCKDFLEFFGSFPGLSEEAANYIGSLRIKMVGTDTPTIDPYSNFQKAQTSNYLEPVHEILLIKHEILVMECLRNLNKLPPRGGYLLAFPLSIHQASGSPVRAVALIPKN